MIFSFFEPCWIGVVRSLTRVPVPDRAMDRQHLTIRSLSVFSVTVLVQFGLVIRAHPPGHTPPINPFIHCGRTSTVGQGPVRKGSRHIQTIHMEDGVIRSVPRCHFLVFL